MGPVSIFRSFLAFFSFLSSMSAFHSLSGTVRGRSYLELIFKCILLVSHVYFRYFSTSQMTIVLSNVPTPKRPSGWNSGNSTLCVWLGQKLPMPCSPRPYRNHCFLHKKKILLEQGLLRGCETGPLLIF